MPKLSRDTRLRIFVVAHPDMTLSAVAKVFHLHSRQHVWKILNGTRPHTCEGCYHKTIICACREPGDMDRSGWCSDWTPPNGVKVQP